MITVQVHSTTMIVALVSETKGCAFVGVTASELDLPQVKLVLVKSGLTVSEVEVPVACGVVVRGGRWWRVA